MFSGLMGALMRRRMTQPMASPQGAGGALGNMTPADLMEQTQKNMPSNPMGATGAAGAMLGRGFGAYGRRPGDTMGGIMGGMPGRLNSPPRLPEWGGSLGNMAGGAAPQDGVMKPQVMPRLPAQKQTEY